MNDASNASALITLAVVSLAGAAIGAILGLIRFSRLEMQDHWTGADVIELHPEDDVASWDEGRVNGTGRRWWTPGSLS